MAEVLEDTQAAVAELCAIAGEEILGFPKLKINGEEVNLCVVQEMTLDEIIAAGGEAEAGGFTAVIPKTSLANAPAKLSEIEARGMALQVLDVRANTDHFVVTAGDPVAEE